MGTVFGVYLKYVVIAVAGALASTATRGQNSEWTFTSAFLMYVAVVNAIISCCFLSCRGMSLIGKRSKDGSIPFWSYVVWGGFHLPTYIYT